MRRTITTAAATVTLAAAALMAPALAHAATCGTATTLTAQTEGPYYTAGAPLRRNVTQAGTAGTPLVLRGQVLDSRCRPVAGATLDFWQADGNGVYDNAGYRLRGRQVTDAEGRYRLTTVVPGQYPGRTEHIHVKITPRGGSTVTTQLYFPDSPHNDEDGIYAPGMEVRIVSDTDALMRAAFTFVMPKGR